MFDVIIDISGSFSLSRADHKSASVDNVVDSVSARYITYSFSLHVIYKPCVCVPSRTATNLNAQKTRHAQRERARDIFNFNNARQTFANLIICMHAFYDMNLFSIASWLNCFIHSSIHRLMRCKTEKKNEVHVLWDRSGFSFQ